jgi:hypothetical protein
MKKFVLTALIAVSLVSSSLAAGTNKVSRYIMNNFASDFTNVKDVEWKSSSSFATATFVQNDKRTQAFYDFTGNLIGTAHAINIDELAAGTKRAFAKKYGNYTVKEAIQFEREGETEYFILAENNGSSLVLKIQNGFISVFK